VPEPFVIKREKIRIVINISENRCGAIKRRKPEKLVKVHAADHRCVSSIRVFGGDANFSKIVSPLFPVGAVFAKQALSCGSQVRTDLTALGEGY
jgi:hypothetical protein